MRGDFDAAAARNEAPREDASVSKLGGSALPDEDDSSEERLRPQPKPHAIVKSVIEGGQAAINYITAEVSERIGTIQLHNPTKRNALSAPLLERFIGAFAAFENADVRVVVLRAGAGDKVWSAGHDIEEIEPGHDPLTYTGLLEKALRCVRHFRFPVIAMVHGSVWGGACDMALNCDLTIGDPTATFAITPALLGVPYNSSGLLHVLNRVGLNVALEMFVTASPIEAERAARVGILNHLVEPSELEGSRRTRRSRSRRPRNSCVSWPRRFRWPLRTSNASTSCASRPSRAKTSAKDCALSASIASRISPDVSRSIRNRSC
jgi:methylmalonyl-CoA decarboxylase